MESISRETAAYAFIKKKRIATAGTASLAMTEKTVVIPRECSDRGNPQTPKMQNSQVVHPANPAKKLGEENEKGLECVRIRLSVYIITVKYEEKKQEIIKSVLS